MEERGSVIVKEEVHSLVNPSIIFLSFTRLTFCRYWSFFLQGI